MRRTHFTVAPIAGVILLIGALVAAAAPVDLHLALSKAEPGVDSTVAAAPQSINLYFTQAPQNGATAIRLVNSADRQVALGEAKQDPDDGKIVRATVEGTLSPGTYQVVWRTLANDGHVVRGDFQFSYNPGS